MFLKEAQSIYEKARSIQPSLASQPVLTLARKILRQARARERWWEFTRIRKIMREEFGHLPPTKWNPLFTPLLKLRVEKHKLWRDELHACQ
jgi:hypothetical protein